MMAGVGSGSGVQVIDSPLLTQQIEAQRLCIKHLKNENNRLKVRITSDLLYRFDRSITCGNSNNVKNNKKETEFKLLQKKTILVKQIG